MSEKQPYPLSMLWLSAFWTRWACYFYFPEIVAWNIQYFREFYDHDIFFFFGLQVFNWRVVDCDLAIGLCTLLPKAEVFKILWKVIDNTWQNYDKILVGKITEHIWLLFVSLVSTKSVCVCVGYSRRWRKLGPISAVYIRNQRNRRSFCQSSPTQSGESSLEN